MRHIITRNIILFCLLFFECLGNVYAVKHYNVRVDVRFGSKFYSVIINNDGNAYAIKGRGSNYIENFKIITSDTSRLFKLAHIDVFYRNLNKIRTKPFITSSSVTDSPRAEIYYSGKKIYDANEEGTIFWDTFRPIMQQLPKEYNPFLLDGHPFG
jgi:transglutaminase-like putative cysteine protease